MSTFNSVVVIGWVRRDPKLRHSPSGEPILSFSIATSKPVGKPNGKSVNEATFVDVVAQVDR